MQKCKIKTHKIDSINLNGDLMKIKNIAKLVPILLLAGVTSYSLADNATAKPGFYGYTDYLTINIPTYLSQFKQLDYFTAGLNVKVLKCDKEGPVNTCLLQIKKSGNAAITLGSDWQHYCEFYLNDGAFVPLTLYQTTTCSTGNGATNLIQTAHYSYTVRVW